MRLNSHRSPKNQRACFQPIKYKSSTQSPTKVIYKSIEKKESRLWRTLPESQAGYSLILKSRDWKYHKVSSVGQTITIRIIIIEPNFTLQSSFFLQHIKIQQRIIRKKKITDWFGQIHEKIIIKILKRKPSNNPQTQSLSVLKRTIISDLKNIRHIRAQLADSNPQI